MAQPEPRKLHDPLSSQGTRRPMPCLCSEGAKATLKTDIKRSVLVAGATVLGREQRGRVWGKVAKGRSSSSIRKGMQPNQRGGEERKTEGGEKREKSCNGSCTQLCVSCHRRTMGLKGREYVRVCRKDQEFQSPHKGQKSIKVLTRDSNIRGQQGV